jgi:hypothetical protein
MLETLLKHRLETNLPSIDAEKGCSCAFIDSFNCKVSILEIGENGPAISLIYSENNNNR